MERKEQEEMRTTRLEIEGLPALERCRWAERTPERMRGLLGCDGLAPGEGMAFPRCNAIHTFFMSFSIDATFLDAENRVVKIVRNIRPWRPLVWGGWRAKKVLETEARIRPFG